MSKIQKQFAISYVVTQLLTFFLGELSMLAYFLFAFGWWIWTLVVVRRLDARVLVLFFSFGLSNALMFGSYDVQKLAECYYSLSPTLLKEVHIESEYAPALSGSMCAALGLVVSLHVLRRLDNCRGANLNS